MVDKDVYKTLDNNTFICEMNILFIETSISPNLGGVERVTWQISSWLSSQNHNCFFAYYKEDGKGIVPKENLLRYNLSMSEKDFVNLFISYIDQHNISVVISQGIIMWQIWALFKKLRYKRMCKCIFCYHNTPTIIEDTDNGFSTRLLKLIAGFGPCNKVTQKIRQRFNQRLSGTFAYKQLYNSIDQCILLSESFRLPFLEKIKDSKDHIICIPNPLSFTLAQIDYKTKKRSVLLLCRIEERQKNITGALRIWKKIEDYGVLDWCLNIVGDGPDFEKIQYYANYINVKNVIFWGATTDAQSFFAESEIFMMTSHFEGFGITIIEAQQCGCVPIVFDTFTTAHDLITNGENGFLEEKGEEEKFAEKLICLMKNDALRRTLAKKGQQSVLRFRLKEIGGMWENVVTKNNR